MLIYYGTGITTTISFRKYEGEHSFIKEGIPLTGSVLRCVSPVNAGRLHAVRKRGIYIKKPKYLGIKYDDQEPETY